MGESMWKIWYLRLTSNIKNTWNSTTKSNILIQKFPKDMNRLFSKEDMQIASKYLKRCSISLIIREMQIKTTRRYHLSLGWLLPSPDPTKKNPEDKYWQGWGETGIPVHYNRNVIGTVTEETVWVWEFQKYFKIELPYDLAIPILSIYAKASRRWSHKDICTHMFTALSTIAKM